MQIETPVQTPATREADQVGTTLARAGVLALLAGAAFAFKHAIDRGLIGPSARVTVGLLAGAGLIAYGERARRRGWMSLAGALTGGGAAMLYLSVLVAGETFHLIARPTMLIGLIGVTFLTGWLATRHDSQPLAVLAAVGALANPVLLMHAAAHEGVMAYLVALNAAALLLALRRWLVLEVVLFAGSALIFAAAAEHVPLAVGAVYATVLVALATAPAFLRREDDAAVLTPQITAGFAYLAFLIHGNDGRIARTAAAMVVAVTYATLAQTARKLRCEALAGAMFAVSFGGAVLAAGYGFGGRGALAAWSVQGAALLWFGTRHNLALPTAAGFTQFGIATLFGLGALVDHDPARGFLNPDAAAFAVQIAAVWFVARIAPRAHEFSGVGVPLHCLAHVMTIVWLASEVFVAAGRGQAGSMAISSVWAAYGALLVTIGVRRAVAEMRWAGVSVFVLVGTKLAVYDLWLLGGMFRSIAFLGFGAVLIGSGVAYQRLRALDDPRPRA